MPSIRSGGGSFGPIRREPCDHFLNFKKSGFLSYLALAHLFDDKAGFLLSSYLAVARAALCSGRWKEGL
jgi:hypothetical protein